MKNAWFTLGVAILPLSILVGCGNGTSPSANSSAGPTNRTTSRVASTTKVAHNSSVSLGNAPYKGAAKLIQFENTAKANPRNANDQIQAGNAARVNGNDTLAIYYYHRAISVDPKNGTAYYNLGNIYLRDQHQPQKALLYYLKATQVQPSYAYGWLSLALTYGKLGQAAEEKKLLIEGMNKTPHAGPAYQYMQLTLKGLK